MAGTYNPYAEPLREILEDFPDDRDIIREAAKRGCNPADAIQAIKKRNAHRIYQQEQATLAQEQHKRVYGKTAPGMAPALDVAADMWLAKFDDAWVPGSELDQDYRVVFQRLGKFGAFEIMEGYQPGELMYRLLPRDLWGKQCK